MFSASSGIPLLTLFVAGVAWRRRMSFFCSKILPMPNKFSHLSAQTIHQISIQWQQINGSTINVNSNLVFYLCVLADTFGKHEMWNFFQGKIWTILQYSTIQIKLTHEILCSTHTSSAGPVQRFIVWNPSNEDHVKLNVDNNSIGNQVYLVLMDLYEMLCGKWLLYYFWKLCLYHLYAS